MNNDARRIRARTARVRCATLSPRSECLSQQKNFYQRTSAGGRSLHKTAKNQHTETARASPPPISSRTAFHSSFFFFNDPAPPEFSPFPLPDAFPTPRRYADHGGSRSHRGGIALAAQKLSTSTIAWAKAWGASCGKLCPIPPEMVRCAYLPENLLA